MTSGTGLRFACDHIRSWKTGKTDLSAQQSPHRPQHTGDLGEADSARDGREPGTDFEGRGLSYATNAGCLPAPAFVAGGRSAFSGDGAGHARRSRRGGRSFGSRSPNWVRSTCSNARVKIGAWRVNSGLIHRTRSAGSGAPSRPTANGSWWGTTTRPRRICLPGIADGRWVQVQRFDLADWAHLTDVALADGRFALMVAPPTNDYDDLLVYHVDYANAAGLAAYARRVLYYPEAAASGSMNPNTAVFRYKHLLYTEDNLGIRPDYQAMPALFGDAERQLAEMVKQELARGLALQPEDPSAGQPGARPLLRHRGGAGGSRQGNPGAGQPPSIRTSLRPGAASRTASRSISKFQNTSWC